MNKIKYCPSCGSAITRTKINHKIEECIEKDNYVKAIVTIYRDHIVLNCESCGGEFDIYKKQFTIKQGAK